MKKFFVILLVVFGLSAQAQQSWQNVGYGKSSDFDRVGAFAGFQFDLVGRPSLNSVSQGGVEAGLFFGKGAVNFLMLASTFGQSEIVRYDVSGAGMCNACQEYILDWQRFLTANRFQIGLAGQGGSTIWMLSGGIAGHQRSVGQWMVDQDGVEFYDITPLARQTIPTGELRLQTKGARGLLSLEVVYLGTSDLAGSRARLSYLLDLRAPGQFFGIGPAGGVYQHVLTGTEYQFGPELWLGGADDFKSLALRLYAGASYNPDPREGLGWFVTFNMTVNRQYKRL